MEENFFTPDRHHFHYTGRIDFTRPERPRMSGPGSKITFRFHGSSCTASLKDQHRYNGHNYIVVILDGNYYKRFRLENDITRYPLADDLKPGAHTVTICKATESQVGYLDFPGVFCSQLAEPPEYPKRLIEFIGDSITAGSGIDISAVPCGDGAWYDQHNAYLSYGAATARMLDADWQLSAVSGIGLCRYWNRESPSMMQVYDRLYLDAPPQGKWNSTTPPDCIVIAIGTNDFNTGDGSYKRKPVEAIHFADEYIRFIGKLRHHYPEVPICLLASPFFSGEQDELMREYLSDIQTRVTGKIGVFHFSAVFSGGCDGHPDLKEHRCMANELTPFLKQFLGW